MPRSKKKKLKLGDFLKDNGNAIGAAGNMVAAGLNSTVDASSTIGGVGTGLLQGASTGAAFGLPGAAIGAAIGGVSGLIGANDAQDAEQRRKGAMNSAEDQFLLNNAGSQRMKHGGRLLAKKLDPMAGGHLQAVSDNAVEVKANNPNQTDSVELQDAYVDNNEIIDRQNRVFSDSVFAPNGKSIAKTAKKLEKQKAEDHETRFSAANERIESKLDNLFRYQEDMKRKKPSTNSNNFTNTEVNPDYPDQQALADGGSIGKSAGSASSVDRSGKAVAGSDWEQFAGNLKDTWNGKKNTVNPNASLKFKAAKARGGRLVNNNNSVVLPNVGEFLDNTNPIIEQAMKAKNIQMSLQKYGKADFKKGGKIPALYNTPPSNTPKTKLDPGGFLDMAKAPKLGGQLGQAAFGDSNKQPDYNQGVTQLATFGPNLLNSFLQKKLQGPPGVQQEQATRLERIDPSAQLAGIDTDANLTNQLILKNTAQSGNVASALGSNLARKLHAKNDVFGQTQHLNAGIQGNEAFMNTQKQARNADRVNMNRLQQTEFANKKLELSSQNVSNLSGKILQQGRERNQIELDKKRARIMADAYGDSGVLDRLYNKDPEDYKDIKKNGGVIRKRAKLKKGGKLNTKMC